MQLHEQYKTIQWNTYSTIETNFFQPKLLTDRNTGCLADSQAGNLKRKFKQQKQQQQQEQQFSSSSKRNQTGQYATYFNIYTYVYDGVYSATCTNNVVTRIYMNLPKHHKKKKRTERTKRTKSKIFSPTL